MTWNAFLAAEGQTWARNHFQDNTIFVLVAGGHQLIENPDGGTVQVEATYD